MPVSIKSQILRTLEESRHGYISGGMLANQLAVSRNAVWKSVNTLRSEGYQIAAVTNRGYRLESSGDILSAEGITRFLRTKGLFIVEVRKSVTSTNTVLRDIAEKGAPEGHVIAADEQTAGKGRMGRAFHSPAGHGAYFSLLLRPETSAGDASLITSAAAVAAARAIEEITGANVGIKWVNDLLVSGKKVCGILTEATFGIESGVIESVILGIGINVTRPENGFPGTLDEYAASIYSETAARESVRCRIIAAALDNFHEYYTDLPGRRFLEEYRSRSVILGTDVCVLTGNEEKKARALEINDDCGLLVRYEDGETETLRSGQVSVLPTA